LTIDESRGRIRFEHINQTVERSGQEKIIVVKKSDVFGVACAQRKVSGRSLPDVSSGLQVVDTGNVLANFCRFVG
jgi:hypothetical protein